MIEERVIVNIFGDECFALHSEPQQAALLLSLFDGYSLIQFFFQKAVTYV